MISTTTTMTIAIMSSFTGLLRPLLVAGVLLAGADVDDDTRVILFCGGLTCVCVIVGAADVVPCWVDTLFIGFTSDFGAGGLL